MEIDPRTGLPVDAMAWDDLAKEGQRIRVTTDKKRYGKIVTIVSGFDKGTDIKSIAKALKNELACGGTYRENEVELQGDHRAKVKKVLVKLGFDENSIEE
ncbi:MAG: stress response translation initiation inhibitor YciH [Nanoarchaeota archaeon]|nr:stress response translation initiation inhibitor YciH [Nanoarchaeota archaeon]